MVVSAVSTTGIYCRPECGAKPHPRNVSPYSTPVAAEAAGYRPCLRCRPDRHLATTDAHGVPRAVAVALGLISDGFLDRFDEAALAYRVGYSPRQLRRLFEQHVGATPDFVARSRRAHFARRLLDETDLSMPVIAGAAGFGSVRQMNRVVESIFAFSPSELRRKRRGGDVLMVDGGLRLRLPFVEPLDRTAARTHLAPRVTPRVESLEGSVYRRTLVVCGNPGVIEVDLGGHTAHLELTAHLPAFDSIIDDVARIRAMFGLDHEISRAEAHLMSDPLMAPLVERHRGLRVIGGWDPFEVAVRVVVGQQVSVAGATTLTARIVARYGRALPAPALGLDRLFPGPDRLVDIDGAGIGMPKRRASSIAALARAVLDGALDLYGTVDLERTRGQLLAIAGIGPWTADMIAMRALGDPDAFPAADLGIRQAVAALVGEGAPSPVAEVAEVAERWRPHRALAAQHLWASLRDTVPTEARVPPEVQVPQEATT